MKIVFSWVLERVECQFPVALLIYTLYIWHLWNMSYLDGSDDVGVDEGNEIDGEDEGRGVVGDFVGSSAQQNEKRLS